MQSQKVQEANMLEPQHFFMCQKEVRIKLNNTMTTQLQ
jgi:hypothetical protein